MSDSKDNLKDRFDNFEPEVDETRIEQNWQKLKEQMPEGKKDPKKGFFYLFLSLGFILAIGIGVVIYFIATNQQNSSDNFITDTAISKKSIDQVNSNDQKSNANSNEQKITSHNQNVSNDNINQSSDDVINSNLQTNQNKFDQNKKTIGIQGSTSAKQLSRESNLSNISKENNVVSATSNYSFDSKIKNTDEKKTISEEITTKGDPTISKSNPIKNSSKTQILNTDQLSGNETKNEQKELAQFDETEVLPENMIIHSIYSLSKDSFYPEIYGVTIKYTDPANTDKKAKKISIEILAGPSFTSSKMINNLNDSSYTEKYSTIGFSGNLGINYEITPRFKISTQYFYNKVSFNSAIDNTHTIDFYRSINQTNTPPDTVSYLDTTKKYFEYNSNYSLKSLNSHLFGLGLNYHIIDFKKLFFDAGIAFNVKMSSYNYEKIGKMNTDTLTYQSQTYTVQDTTNFNQTSYFPVSNYPDINHSVKNDFKYSFGVTPNIVFGYNVNQRLSLLLKGSYYFDLGENKIDNEELLMRIKQNSIFLHFGVRIKL